MGRWSSAFLEAGYSARDGAEHGGLLDELLTLPHLGIDERVEARVLDAQRQLARAGHHRRPPVDLLLAGLANRHRVALVHYDAHYDVIAVQTDLRFEVVWVAPRGSLRAAYSSAASPVANGPGLATATSPS